MSLSVSSLKKRLERLEQVYSPGPAMDNLITWPEFEFWYAFRQTYKSCDDDSAPPFLRREAKRYRRIMMDNWERQRQDEAL
jgi:hypothetical protein